MPGVETLRDFVNQRLTAAAEEIFGVFERTIAEYEEQLCRCKEENKRKQKLLDDVQLHFHRADNQQLQATQEDVFSELQEWSFSLDQEDTEPPHIKEGEEELWSSQEGIKEDYPIRFSFAPVLVKTEDDEEKPQSSQLHEIQSEGMKTGADEEDYGGPEQAWRDFDLETQDKTGDCSDAETDDSGDWRDTMEHDSGLNCVEKLYYDRSDNDKKSHSCSQCGKIFRRKCHLASHMRAHQTHLKHLSFSDCGKRFKHKAHLNSHTFLHTGEWPFSSSKCDKTFNKKSTLTNRMLTHGQEKHFSCPRCGKKFNHKSSLTNHMLMHTGEKPFSCSECDTKFNQKSNLNRHMVIHTGEKPFSCSECDKKFSHKSYLTSHMVIHTREKPFRCELCNKHFPWVTQVKNHKCTSGQTA